MVEEIDTLLGDQGRRHELEQSSEELRALLSWDGKADQLLALYRHLLPGKFSEHSQP